MTIKAREEFADAAFEMAEAGVTLDDAILLLKAQYAIHAEEESENGEAL